MTMIAEPIIIISTAVGPVVVAPLVVRPVVLHPGVSRSGARESGVRQSGAGRPGVSLASVQPIAVVVAVAVADLPDEVRATTEQLLARRDGLAAGDPGRAVLRTRVIEENLPMANRLARRYAGRGETFDDLAQVAALALVKAVDGYDPARLVPFASYAFPYILGALKRHFRDSAWGMRVPRATQELSRHLNTATNELSQAHGRTPTPAEVADHLQVSAKDLRFAAGAAQVYRLPSLNAVRPGTDTTELVDVIGDVDPGYVAVDDKLVLAPLLAALPLRERRILAMRYADEMTQSSIANEVGISQMQVSRLLTQTLTQLRASLPT